MLKREHHQKALTSKDIKVQPKAANIAGLQLADVLAHPVKQACLVEAGLIPEPGEGYGGQMCEAMHEKFHRSEIQGVVEGYGKVLFL